MNKPSTSHHLLEALCEIGVEYLFCNLGTDHAPIVEELAKWKKAGRNHPSVVICAHENLAMHMAMGYAMTTGKGQAVLVHVDVGVANAVMGMHNMLRSHVPVILMAGKAPFTLRGELPGSRDAYVNFVQEPFDMASMVRPYSKWSYDLPSGVVARECIIRAHAVMNSNPPGPVFLTAAREVLMTEHGDNEVSQASVAQHGPVTEAGIDDATLNKLADMILAAKAPAVITTYSGRHPDAPAALDALARFAGMAVYEATPVHVNIPRDSPCFAGYQADPHLSGIDFGLLLDVDAPWVPKYAKENPATRWAVVDADALKQYMPHWGFPAHLRLQADSAKVLPRLLELLRERADAAWRKGAEARLAELTKKRAEATDAAKKAAANKGEKNRMTVPYVASELSKVISADDILVHEAITNIFPVLGQIVRTKPLTAFGNGGGGLGIGGVALGAKLARPDRMVVHITGDGSFIFSNPEAMMVAERSYNLPVFTVVLDNGGWNAVKGATLRVFPDGVAKSMGEFHAVLGKGLRHDKIAETVGGHAECVEDPAELPAAIARCVDAVRKGEPTILVVRVERID